MYVKLSKKFITKNLLPHLSQTNLGRKPKVPLWRIVKMIIYRLKSGCQWRELPIPAFCNRILVNGNSVYYHFNKRSKDNSWKRMWINLLSIEKSKLDISSVQLDGSHTPAKRGGEANAWIDAFKALLVLFETKARTWISLHHLAFSLILIRV
jgi:transposase